MYTYEPFYRNFGIRKIAHLLQPPLPVLDKLSLPTRSILHFVSDNPLEGGPAVDEYVFRHVTKPIQMAHVTELGHLHLGNPRRKSVSAPALIHAYHTQHRRFRPMRDLAAAVRDDQTLVVYNYGFLPALYTYQRSLYTEYNKCVNVQAALWDQVAKLAAESDRHQFILLHLPRLLPSIPDLRIGTSGTVNQRLVEAFNTPESVSLLQLWMWFGPERAASLLASIPEDRLDRVNLVFQETGRWFVLNLGLVNSWRQATKEEQLEHPGEHTKGLDAASFQRRFLRLMMSLSHVRTDAAPEVDAVVDAVPVATPAPAEVAVVKLDAKLPVADAKGVVRSTAQKLEADAPADGGATDRLEDVVQDTTVQQRVDADLAELERIQVEGPLRPSDDGDTWLTQTLAQPSLEEGMMRICNRLADVGSLSAAEYRRYTTLAQAYKNIPAPDGSGNLDTFIQVPAETLAMPKSPALANLKAVVDKTMLSSSLLEFDERYIKNVMHKDVAGMVLNVQHAGIAVTGYESTKVEDVLGSYYDHTVRITPVEGSTSTLRFKLPALEDDGTYMANGTKYRMRKQRGDLPIRKIAPNRVALTSYYGKLFVTRSEKRVNDYGQWLRNQVMALGLDNADPRITQLHPGNVFDNTFADAPKMYTTLAQGFRGFVLAPRNYDRTGGNTPWEISLDHTQREKLYGAAALRQYEQKGAIIIGKNALGSFLVVDAHGMFYRGVDGHLSELGTLEYMLGLEAQKAPVDFAEVKVLGRTIPLGIVLGYELGLENLCTLLQCTPRRVPAGSRASVEDSEYALVFSDETLVFARENRLAALVLAGFREYHQAIRGFAVHLFDKPGVYLNVLESGGPSARYVRELDLLQQLFVDPVTRDLLVEMKEPTNFRGLLLRSCEMLLIDQHPSELDPAWMRIKGYERMAGAVYSELVKSIRAHSGRSGKSRQAIDLNPYAVWTKIARDPSIALVSDINPIENLKQQEAVTYSGDGGRGSRSMTKHTREYHRNDMGTISESTVDSSDVAINTFTSADPQFTSLRGISRRYKIGESGATALLSTSALLSPGSDKDD